MTYYFSVESRKGGVGKTTVALNLGRCLLNARYKVLLLDCDITGTSIAQCCENSVFWEECVNVVKHEKEEEVVPVNLLDYFRNIFLMGEEEEWNKKGSSIYDPERINVIGSELYDKEKLVIDPRELMDELHSYWVVTMLQGIVANFEGKDSEKTAVIIDNSPGYAGMGRAVHEWLTNIGPKYARFLLVSSLDEQDIQSTVYSMKEIQRIMEGKVRVNSYYHSLNKEDKKAMLNQKEEQFLKSDNCFDRFFYMLANGKSYIIDTTDYTLQKYTAIVFNKVGDECKDEEYTYDFEGLLTGDNLALLQSLWGNQDKGYQKYMIAFDENIQSQFFSRRLKNAKEGTEKYWKGRFEKLAEDVDNLRGMRDAMNASFKLDKHLDSLKSSMTQKGRKKLSADIGKDWYFRIASEHLNRAITDIAYYNKPDNLLDLTHINKQQVLDFNHLRLQQFVTRMKLGDYEPVFDSVFEYTYNLAGAGKNKRDIRLLVTVSVFINTFMCMHEAIWGKEKYRDFLITESKRDIAGDSVKRYLGKFVPIAQDVELSTDLFLGVAGKCFEKFYHTLCYTILRVIDRFENFKLLTDTFEKIIATPHIKVIPAEIKKHLDHMIIDQTEECGMKDIDKVILDTIRMNEFEKVINHIIVEKWNL